MKAILACLCLAWATSAPAQQVQPLASFPDRQITGVAVSRTGRIFLCSPGWSKNHRESVLEMHEDGSTVPYPNADWNRPLGVPASRWVCVQSVFVDANDALWVLDAGSPERGAVAPGGAKLIRVNLATNQPDLTLLFGASEAPTGSYLNDVRVDTYTDTAYLSDSGLGAIVVVDLRSRTVRRVLAGSPATRAEPGVDLIVDGTSLTTPGSLRPPRVHCDGLAFNNRTGYLYFHALTGRTLYGINTVFLRDATLDDRALAQKVEKIGETPPCDGMLVDANGNILLTDVEHHAIGRWDSVNGSYSRLISDPRLQWPDTMAWGPQGKLYVTTSQLHRSPRFNGGEDAVFEPFGLWKVTLPGPAAADRRQLPPIDAEAAR